MKKIYILCLLAACSYIVPVCGQSLFLASTAEKDIASIDALNNPDRGLHLESIYQVSGTQAGYIFNPYNKGAGQGGDGEKEQEVYPIGFMDTRNDDFSSHQDSISLTQLYIYLTDFCDTDEISQIGLDNVQILLNGLRENRVKAILRFAYHHDRGGKNPGAARTVKHLAQLKPLLENNADVLSVVQIGLIGMWGEWTPAYTQAENNSIIKALLESLPADYGVEARYTWIKNNAKSVLSTDDFNRIGYCNDYFTTGLKNCGSDFCPGDAQYIQVAEESFTTYISGEIPYNEGPPWGFDIMMDIYDVANILKEHHYTAFDITQNFKDNITFWKSAKVSPKRLSKNNIFFEESYFMENGVQAPRSFYQFVRDHLGYRLNVKSANLSPGPGNMTFNIELSNTGFAAVHNPKNVYLVLIDENDNIIQEARLGDANPQNWQPWEKGAPEILLTHFISGTVMAPTTGTYKVGVLISDAKESLKDMPEYQIKFALDNNKVTHWTNAAKTRIVNILGEITF